MRKPLATLVSVLALSACGDNADNVQNGPGQRVATLSAQHAARPVDLPSAAALALYTPLVQQLYVAFFGRPADPDGLAFYVSAFERFGAPDGMRALLEAYQRDPDIRGMVDGLAASAETHALYGDEPGQLISALYLNSFNRDADDSGFHFWVMAIHAHGLGTAAAVLSILAGAQGTDVTTFQRKADAARMFTAALEDAGAQASYSGHGANAPVRDMLRGLHGSSTDADLRRAVDASVVALRAGQSWVMRDGHAEVPAGAREVLLLVASAQHEEVRARLDTLSSVLAADLNARSGEFGPTWSVSVQRAATTVPAVRDQLKGKAGAILIGDVIVPTHLDLANGDTTPNLNPYRTPFCTRYRFPNGPRVVEPAPGTDHIWVTTEDPACRNGLTVSILRGTNQVRQSAELASKLDQMIAYHRASERANAAWSAQYRHINAVWLGTAAPPQDGPSFWKDIALFDPQQIHYLSNGTGRQRLDAFRDCLSSTSAMCTFNGHGASGLVMSEGPDPIKDFYSSDVVYFNAYELREMPLRAKFVDLQSCSTQNFLKPDSFGTTMLMAGDTLLVHGATAVVTEPLEVDKRPVQEIYQTLSSGATFAEAYAGKMEGNPLNLQGDPYISLRSKPTGPQPLMVVDDKHYNTLPSITALAMGDSTGAVSFRTVMVSNKGNAELRLRLSIFVADVTATGRTLSPDGGYYSGLSFVLDRPNANATSGYGNVGDVVHTVPPGGQLALRFRFEPQTDMNTGKRVTGLYTGHYDIYSNDPHTPRLRFELSANAH